MFNDPTLCHSFSKDSVSSQRKILYQPQRLLLRVFFVVVAWFFYSIKTWEHPLRGTLIRTLWDSSSSHIGFVPFNFLFEVSCM